MLLKDGAHEEVFARHRKELRDLVASTTSMKKQATKKTRKNVLLLCADLQIALQTKHEKEIALLDQATSSELDNAGLESLSLDDVSKRFEQNREPETDLMSSVHEASSTNEVIDETIGKHDVASIEPLSVDKSSALLPKKRNRQKERLEKRRLEIERIKAEASAEAEGQIDYRQIEFDSMAQILAFNDLVMYEIRPDGHCLFALIQDQLSQRHNVNVSVAELRREAAQYISDNSEDFIPFLFDESTCEMINISSYIDELTNTAMWGSDMEILALGRKFDCPITVYVAGAQELVINSLGTKKGLKLGYYKHSYGLGEHYNSLRDLEQPPI